MPARSNTRFSKERYDDQFDQFSATLSGNLTDDIDFVLNTSIFERDTAYTYDYAAMLNIIMQPMHIMYVIYMSITVITMQM